MNNNMLAAVLHGAGDIRVETVAKPSTESGMVLLRIKRAGICGSDLHYYEHGYCGSFVPSKPFILGHELIAEVIAVNSSGLYDFPTVGARVTVNPARSCGDCAYCNNGRPNLCRRTIMLGSGSTVPPTNGAMAEFVTVRADQCFALPDNMDDGIGALIEPLAVGLQAIKQAGTVENKTVLVTGGGVIGLLTAAIAKAYGASLVAVSDIVAERRQLALDFGVAFALNPADKQMQENVTERTGDGFDIIFEASGAVPALRQAFDVVRPGGTIVQIGTLPAGDIPLPANLLMVKEIKLIGSFRYAAIYEEAIALAASGKINLQPFITGVFNLNDVSPAMRAAGDKAGALKVQIEINN